jgi:ABC-type multidrug transport system fused ATPase/permease subunit
MSWLRVLMMIWGSCVVMMVVMVMFWSLVIMMFYGMFMMMLGLVMMVMMVVMVIWFGRLGITNGAGNRQLRQGYRYREAGRNQYRNKFFIILCVVFCYTGLITVNHNSLPFQFILLLYHPTQA